jgi:hypothetical protein
MNERISAGPPAFPQERKRALLFLAALCMPALSVQGCAERATMRGDRPSVQRIVSLVPSATEILVATAEPSDDEMRERIDLHRSRRPAEWITVEAPRGSRIVV